MKWWKDPKITKLYAVGVPMVGMAMDQQTEGWMIEGLFETEAEAVAHCTNDNHFVVPVPVGMMTGREMPDGLWWPRLQSKEDGQQRLEAYREQQIKEIEEGTP